METLSLLTPYQMGAYTLKNRMVLAPMTRNRALAGNVPNPLAIEYYRQRATAGLIITEATQVSPQGVGYPATPGIHTQEQVAGWKKITDAVHEAGSRIFLQLWHVGRISHSSFHGGEAPVAPSAIKPEGQAFTYEGFKDYETPRALKVDELPGIVEMFRQGAALAKEAGFDGVEIHGANGYLLDQFLNTGTNTRTDAYGGSIENRARLVFEVIDAVAEVWGADKVGIRFSPSGLFNDMYNEEPVETFDYVINKLNDYGLAYIHLIEAYKEVPEQYLSEVTAHYRKLYNGTIITASGYTRETGLAAIDNQIADLVAYGRPYLANPDLPARFAQHAELNEPDQATFYGGTEKGYTDYPFLNT